MIGIALLTLVPGELGGSESATRELLRALARGGTLPYRVYLPPVAPDAGEGLPSEVVGEYRLARTIPGPARGDDARRGPARAARPAARRGRRRPLPADDPASRRSKAPTAITLHDVQHLDLPQLFSRGERAFRSLAYHRSARSARIVIVPSAFVRDRAGRALGLDRAKIRVIHHGIDHERFTPGDEAREPFLLYPARPWPHKNHARLYEAFALLRRERPELRLVLTGGGHSRRARPTASRCSGTSRLDELVSLYRRAVGARLPVAVRGLRAAAARGDGLRLPGRLLERRLAARGVRRRGPVLRSRRAGGDRRGGRRRPRRPGAWSARGLARAAGFTWERSAQAHEDVYRELLAA